MFNFLISAVFILLVSLYSSTTNATKEDENSLKWKASSASVKILHIIANNTSKEDWLGTNGKPGWLFGGSGRPGYIAGGNGGDGLFIGGSGASGGLIGGRGGRGLKNGSDGASCNVM